MTLEIGGGSVHLETQGSMTIEDITNLARAAEIAGIPSNAIITHMSFHWSGETARIQIGWTL